MLTFQSPQELYWYVWSQGLPIRRELTIGDFVAFTQNVIAEYVPVPASTTP
jgi:hypothetical protein